MIRFILGFLSGLAAFYAYALFLSSTPETSTSGDPDGSYTWPLGT